jgi:hypothetical protein
MEGTMTAVQPEGDVLAWRKSRASADAGNCVEVAAARSAVLVRDSKNPAGRGIEVQAATWREFLDRIR